MKKFQFRFAAVEKVKRMKEEEALRELGKSQQALRKIHEHKLGLLQDIERSLIRREELGREPISSVAFQIESEFIWGTKQRIQHLDQAIVRAQKVVEKTMRGYLVARRQTRMIEVLREKELGRFKDEVRKKEAKNSDELTVMRARLILDAGAEESAQAEESGGIA